MEGKRTAIKMLLPNGLTGSLIGTGGKAIKELMSETNARVLVSANGESYPGSSERVVLISGTSDAVSLAQTLVWEMIATSRKADGEDVRNLTWEPKQVLTNLGRNDDVEVMCKVAVPASAGGLLLGRAGATIRSMGEESGAKISMSSKDEALFTQERILTISGPAGACIKVTDMVIYKMCEEDETPQFVFKGTNYHPPNNGMGGMQGGVGMMGAGPYGAAGPYGMPYGVFNPAMAMGGRPGMMTPAAGGSGAILMGVTGPGAAMGMGGGGGMPMMGGGMRGGAGRGGAPGAVPLGGEQTTITLAVPDEVVGNLFGRGGNTLREIISLSGAKVSISGRDEFVDGTTNRIVTIIGSPMCAQTAHMFINQRLQTPSNPPRRGGGGGGGGEGIEK